MTDFAAKVELRRFEQVATRWKYVLSADTDWRKSLEPGFWKACADKFSQGDLIHVTTADFLTQFELCVADVNPTADYLHLLARPLFPANLELPDEAENHRPRYGIRPFGDGLFVVFDYETNRKVGHPVRRAEALASVLARNETDIAAKSLKSPIYEVEHRDALQWCVIRQVGRDRAVVAKGFSDREGAEKRLAELAGCDQAAA